MPRCSVGYQWKNVYTGWCVWAVRTLRPGGSEQSGWPPPRPGGVVDVFSHGKVARYRVALHLRKNVHFSCKVPCQGAHPLQPVLRSCLRPPDRAASSTPRCSVHAAAGPSAPAAPWTVRSCDLQLLLLAGCLGLCAVSRFTKRMVHVRRVCQVTPSPTAIPSYWVMRDSLECPKFSECFTQLLATSMLAPFADKQEMSDRRDASGSRLFTRKINKSEIANMPVSLSN